MFAGLLQNHACERGWLLHGICMKIRLTFECCAESCCCCDCRCIACVAIAAAYLMQYLPLLGWMVLKKVGPGRARALSSGKSGYNVSSMLREQ